MTTSPASAAQPLRRRGRLLGTLVAIALGAGALCVPSKAAEAAPVSYLGAAGAERISVIGDSVMAAIRWYGTWQPLRRYNYIVDVESCRRTVAASCRGREGYTPDNTLNAMRRLSSQLGSVLVVGTGYDDPGVTFGYAVDQVMAEAARQGIPVVIWATMRTADVSYVGPTYSSNASTFRDNNRILLAKQQQYAGRLQVADWATFSASHDEWVEWDGIHLTPSGATAMAQFIADQSAIALRRISAPSAPTLSVSVVSSTQVRLTWTTPTSAGASPIVDYGYQRSSDGGGTWRGGYAGTASARSVVISGLTNGVTYQFRLAARNSSGWGALSNTVSVTPKLMGPSAPRLAVTVVGSGQVLLTWNAPTFTGDGPITYYGYQRSSDGGRTWRGGYAGTAAARSVVISGLTNGITYQYRLAARSSVGWGAISNTFSVTPNLTRPSAPTLSATVVGSGQVQLSWTAPRFTGGAPIEYYGYQRSSDGGVTWRGGYAGPPTARTVVISGLTTGVTYQYRLAARNSVGWSAFSNAFSLTPNAALNATAEVADASVESTPDTLEAPTTSTTLTSTTSVPETTKPTTVATTAASMSAVGDFVWIDSDLDGLQDVGEPGRAGVVVRLIDAGGTILEEQISDSQGRYELTPHSAGSFLLEVVLPDGYDATLVDVGLDDAVDSDVDPTDVVVGPGETTVRVAIDNVGDRDVDLDVGLIAVPEEATTTQVTTTTATSEPSTTTGSSAVSTTGPPTTNPAATTAPPTTVVPEPTNSTVPPTEGPTTTTEEAAVTTSEAVG